MRPRGLAVVLSVDGLANPEAPLDGRVRPEQRLVGSWLMVRLASHIGLAL